MFIYLSKNRLREGIKCDKIVINLKMMTTMMMMSRVVGAEG